MHTRPTTLLHSRSALFALAAVAWLWALIVLALYYPKYVPDGDLLLSTDFEGAIKRDSKICTEDFGCWTCSENGVLIVEKAGFGESKGVRMTPAGGWGSNMLWDLPDPQRFASLEFKGRVRVKDIIRGKDSWNVARSLLYFKDLEGNRRWDYPHTAKRLSGSSSWIEFSKIFPVPDFAVSAHVMIENSARSGSMWVDDLSLHPLRLNHQFFRNRNILLGLGVALLFAFFFTLKIWRDFGWMILVLLLVSLLGVLSPHVYLEEIANILSIKVTVLKKVGHFLVFLAMGILSFLWFQHRSRIRNRIGMSIVHALTLFSALALFAAVTEFLQLLTIDRMPRLTDYLIDLSGSLLGIFLVFLIKKKGGTGFSEPTSSREC